MKIHFVLSLAALPSILFSFAQAMPVETFLNKLERSIKMQLMKNSDVAASERINNSLSHEDLGPYFYEDLFPLFLWELKQDPDNDKLWAVLFHYMKFTDGESSMAFSRDCFHLMVREEPLMLYRQYEKTGDRRLLRLLRFIIDGYDPVAYRAMGEEPERKPRYIAEALQCIRDQGPNSKRQREFLRVLEDYVELRENIDEFCQYKGAEQQLGFLAQAPPTANPVSLQHVKALLKDWKDQGYRAQLINTLLSQGNDMWLLENKKVLWIEWQGAGQGHHLLCLPLTLHGIPYRDKALLIRDASLQSLPLTEEMVNTANQLSSTLSWSTHLGSLAGDPQEQLPSIVISVMINGQEEYTALIDRGRIHPYSEGEKYNNIESLDSRILDRLGLILKACGLEEWRVKE